MTGEWVQTRAKLSQEFIDHHEKRTGKTIAYIAGVGDDPTVHLTFTDGTFEAIRIP